MIKLKALSNDMVKFLTVSLSLLLFVIAGLTVISISVVRAEQTSTPGTWLAVKFSGCKVWNAVPEKRPEQATWSGQ